MNVESLKTAERPRCIVQPPLLEELLPPCGFGRSHDKHLFFPCQLHPQHITTNISSLRFKLKFTLTFLLAVEWGAIESISARFSLSNLCEQKPRCSEEYRVTRRTRSMRQKAICWKVINLKDDWFSLTSSVKGFLSCRREARISLAPDSRHLILPNKSLFRTLETQLTVAERGEISCRTNRLTDVCCSISGEQT